MTNFDSRRKRLSEQIIEVSDEISRNSKRLLSPGFVPDAAFTLETQRLLEECKRLTEELREWHQR